MIKIFDQYDLHHDQNACIEELNQAFNDGFKTVGFLPGWGFNEDYMADGLLILHKPDNAAPAPNGATTSSVNDTQPISPVQSTTTPPQPQTLESFYELVRGNDFVVLDTETTGVLDAEICQIAIIDSNGNELLNTLVKPSKPIPEQASRIHGISNDGVKDAPAWAEVQPQMRDILRGKDVVIYNATFDRKMMHWSDEKAGLPRCDYKTEARYWDAMEFYAEYHGDWNEYHGSYTWQKLTVAAERLGIDTKHAHTAIADCRMTLAVIERMAERKTVGE